MLRAPWYRKYIYNKPCIHIFIIITLLLLSLLLFPYILISTLYPQMVFVFLIFYCAWVHAQCNNIMMCLSVYLNIWFVLILIWICLNKYLHNIAQLQWVQNNLARVVCRAPRRSSPSALLKRLHWLPIEHRIRYKIASITHHALVDSSPGYLHELLTPHTPSRNLRSAGKALLVAPNTRTRVGDKSFKAAAPNVWNRLPETIRTISCHNTFKKNLKTVLFKEAFFDS